MSLMDSLGLENVEADPNALPDGKWPGVITRSEYVVVTKNNTVSHVITYQVTDESNRKGAQRQEWFRLGTDPVVDNDGNITSMTPTMSEEQKSWYKKRFVDLGIAEEDVPKTEPKDLVGKQVTFGTKKKDGFINISFVELRDADVTTQATAQEGQTSGGVTGLL